MASNRIALSRLRKELDDIQKNPSAELSVGPSGEDMFRWEGILNGPPDSPYAGGAFKFTIEFPREYPMKPPKVKFVTRVYHPNISDTGHICVDILNHNWTSVYTVSQIMLSISSLLTDPNPSSALNVQSARLYQRNREAYNREVKKWVKKYASPENL